MRGGNRMSTGISNNNNHNYTFQHMLGVWGTSLASPGWPVLGTTVGTGDQTLKIRHYNVIHILFGAEPHTLDL